VIMFRMVLILCFFLLRWMFYVSSSSISVEVLEWLFSLSLSCCSIKGLWVLSFRMCGIRK